ncbi:NAD(P)-binding protein [Rhizodiscina lignyota]|uniref:NAD(P)-binding protein n=1 Tax=Rhizodiscina lignyota TaxID=1504668 RepID=A0A9P4I5D0_9PEZI|nr:NAD(P)-binding protein [Rhizodiscina lignyota]
MRATPTCIAIAGVTGKLGTLIASYLLDTTEATVHGFCRSPEKIEKSLTDRPSRFKVFSGSALSVEDAQKAITGCSTVICAYNRMDFQLMVNSSKVLIEACDAEGVGRFIASDFTLDFRALHRGDLPPMDAHIAVWEYLRQGNENGTIQVKAVHVLVGIFVEAFFGVFFNPKEPKYWGTGNETIDFVSYKSAAEYAARVANDPDEPTGFVKLVDFKATMNEIATAIGRIKGDGSPLPLLHQGSMSEAKEQVRALAGTDTPWHQHISLLSMYYFQTPEFQLGDDLDNHRYPGVKKISLDDAVKEFVNY